MNAPVPPTLRQRQQENLVIGLLLAVLLLGIGMAVQQASAAASANVGSDTDVCRDLVVASVSLQNAAGDVVQCQHYPNHVQAASSTWALSAFLTSPALTGTSPSLTLTATASNGCTAGSPTTVGTAASASSNPQTSSVWVITMTAAQCRGYVEGKVTTGGVTIYDALIAFNVESDDQTRTVANTVSGSLSNTLSGSVANTLSGTVANTISGSLSNTLSGSVSNTLSGTIGTTITGSVSNTVSGALTVHQDPISGSLNVDTLDRACAASGHGASCNPAPLFGNLTLGGLNFTSTSSTSLCSSAALDADAHACTIRIEGQPGNATSLNLGLGRWDWGVPVTLVLAWSAYALITVRLRNDPTRVLVALLGAAWLLVPTDLYTLAGLVLFQLLLIIFSIYAWTQTDHSHTRRNPA